MRLRSLHCEILAHPLDDLLLLLVFYSRGNDDCNKKHPSDCDALDYRHIDCVGNTACFVGYSRGSDDCNKKQPSDCDTLEYRNGEGTLSAMNFALCWGGGNVGRKTTSPAINLCRGDIFAMLSWTKKNHASVRLGKRG